MSKVKTFRDWTNGSLYEYLKVGDLVDEEMRRYFIFVLPPLHFTRDLIQIGEVYGYAPGKGGTFATLKRTEKGWMYCGCCFRESSEEAKYSTAYLKEPLSGFSSKLYKYLLKRKFEKNVLI